MYTALECYGVCKFRCTFAFRIRNLTGVQRYRYLDGSSCNQTSEVYNPALTLSGDVPDQSQTGGSKKIEAGTGSLDFVCYKRRSYL